MGRSIVKIMSIILTVVVFVLLSCGKQDEKMALLEGRETLGDFMTEVVSIRFDASILPFREIELGNIVFNGRYIVAVSNRRRIFVFDTEGQLIDMLDRRGRGPGEYLSIVEVFFLEDDTFAVYDFERALLLLYTITEEGVTFVDDIDVAEQTEGGAAFFPTDKYIVSISPPLRRYDDRIFIYDKNMRLVRSFSQGWPNHAMTADGMTSGVSRNKIVVGDIITRNSDGSVVIGNNLYVYNYQGKRKHVIRHRENRIRKILSDVTGDFVFVWANDDIREVEDYYYVYSLHTGRQLKKISGEIALIEDLLP